MMHVLDKQARKCWVIWFCQIVCEEVKMEQKNQPRERHSSEKMKSREINELTYFGGKRVRPKRLFLKFLIWIWQSKCTDSVINK